jgi:diacylglycerol kinase (ATP)
MAARDSGPGEDESVSPFKGKTGFVRVRNAFFYSCSGIAAAFRHESAFRQEVLLAAILLPGAFWVPVSAVERALLVAAVLLVLIVELVNASVEAVVDRISQEHHPLSGRAKDLGSAAVFVSLILCGAVWAIILWPVLR